VPIPVLKVSEERESLYLPIIEAQAKAVPLMPDQDYEWLSERLGGAAMMRFSQSRSIISYVLYQNLQEVPHGH